MPGDDHAPAIGTVAARRPARSCAATIAASPLPAAVRASNQFQQRPRIGLSLLPRQQHERSLRDRRARAMRVRLRDVLRRLLAAVDQHQQRRAPPARRSRAERRAGSRAAAQTSGTPMSQPTTRTSRLPRSGRAPASRRNKPQRSSGPVTSVRKSASYALVSCFPRTDVRRPPEAVAWPRSGENASACRARAFGPTVVRSVRCRTAPACRASRPAARSACR